MKVIIATDGSEHSKKAVKTAAFFLFPPGSEIKIISVVENSIPLTLDLYGTGFIPPSAELGKIARDNALKILDDTKTALIDNFPAESVEITTELLAGSPENQIVETAEKFQADLIIVGSHGYNTWERLLLGSVSDSVVHHAPCSVLVVRSPKS